MDETSAELSILPEHSSGRPPPKICSAPHIFASLRTLDRAPRAHEIIEEE